MKPLNRPVIKITIFFLLGVIAGFNFEIDFQKLLIGLGGCFLVFLIFFFVARKQLFQDIYFGIATYLLFFGIGVFTVNLHSPSNNPQHYTNHLPQEQERVLITGKVVKILNPSRYYQKYILELKGLGEKQVDGEILLNIDKPEKEGGAPLVEIDDRVVLKTNLAKINPPKNPHQFNYSEYMQNRGVFRQVYTTQKKMLILKNPSTSYLGYAENIRQQIVVSLEENGLSAEQLAMVQALLLGQTRDITDETYDNYAAAGVIHILSVSGLHVGFVLLILNFIFKPLERLKHGKIPKVILVIVLLWGFALLAGFSSPVVRSVTMFSFVAIGLNWGRKTHILNILFLSLFVILLFAPGFIFEIGFQLSYLAVFSIVIFQPKFYKLYRPRFWIDKLFWGVLTVTFAAQIGVVPLSLYYFHQFPGLFFLSNLLVVPYVGFLLGFGMLVILLAFLGLLPKFLAELFGFSIDILNVFVAWCARQEAFLFQEIHFSFWEMMASYVFIFFLVLLAWGYSYKKLIACLVSAALLLGVFVYEKKKIITSDQFLVFDKNRKTILGFKDGKHLHVFHNLQGENISEEYAVRNFTIGEGIDRISSDSLGNIYRVNKNFLLIVDSLGVYKLPELKNPLVLLRNSPQINLERLVELLQPKKIIADGSNYHSYVDRWRRTCERKKIPFHYTRKMGAFVAELNSDR